MRVALTGGIGTGKSYCAGQFRDLGVPVIDADDLAHEAVAPGTKGLAAVVARFGPGVLQPGGQLNRPFLGRLVFADPSARKDLEAIIHPEVYRAIEAWFEQTPGLALADIPLLFETGHQRDFDRVVVVICGAATQRRRLAARGLSEPEITQRLSSQLPLAEKVRGADFVIETSGSFAETDGQVREVYRALCNR